MRGIRRPMFIRAECRWPIEACTRERRDPLNYEAMAMTDIVSDLSAPFPVSSISWRVGSTNGDKTKGMALAYIDARDAQDRLNRVCGPFGWQCKHEVSTDKRVTCHVGIRNPESGEWVWKSDGAGETDYEGEKGSYSDSFKRACVKWGIGRYLYEMDSPWVAIEAKGRTFTIPPASIKSLNEKLLKSQTAYFGGSAPDPMAKANGTQEAWNYLDEDTKAALLKFAARVITTAKTDMDKAVKIWSGEQLSSDERAGVWSQFDSKLRRAITEAVNKRKSA